MVAPEEKLGRIERFRRWWYADIASERSWWERPQARWAGMPKWLLRKIWAERVSLLKLAAIAVPLILAILAY